MIFGVVDFERNANEVIIIVIVVFVVVVVVVVIIVVVLPNRNVRKFEILSGVEGGRNLYCVCVCVLLMIRCV